MSCSCVLFVYSLRAFILLLLVLSKTANEIQEKSLLYLVCHNSCKTSYQLHICSLNELKYLFLKNTNPSGRKLHISEENKCK